MKNDNLIYAIARTATAIQYITWAIETEEIEEKLGWIKSANDFLENAQTWLKREMPF